MSASTGDYGEQGEFATDGQMEDQLVGTGVADDEQPDGEPAGAEDDTGPIPGGGALLAQPDAGRVFRKIDDIVRRQERLARNREEKKRHWDNVREGKPFAYLEHNEDRSIFKATVAPGVEGEGNAAVPNKMDDLCNKIISQILADDFLPDPKPDGDADSDRGAADLGKKFLRADGQTSGTDDRQLLRDALNSNITGAAEGVLVWVDKTAGGWRPMQIMAHARAEDATRPLYAPMLDQKTGMPIIAAGKDGVPAPIMEKASQPVLRYVATQGGERIFVEDATQADRQWLPKHRRKLLSINQIRCVPQSASVFDASSITLVMYDTVGEAKKRFQTLRTMKSGELKTLCQWRPPRWKSIVPEAHRPKDSEGSGPVTDDSLLFWYEHYCVISPDYPDGAQICVNGAGKAGTRGQGSEGTMFLRDTLREDVDLDDGAKQPILMLPPVSVFACVNDIRDRDPLGAALLARFGGGKEAHDQIWAGMFDAMWKALNRNSFIPGTSTVTKEDMNRRDGSPIEILTKDDIPSWEEIAELPTFVPELLTQLDQSFNSAAGTNETSNGLDSQFAVSGVAKEVAIKTARVALAQYWQNTVKGLTHYWRIKLQLAQARLTVPQMVRLSGVESAYKQPWFVGTDMCGVSEVALQAGSGSMMTPTEKAQHLGFLQQQQWLDPEQAGELARSSMQDDLGLPPNIHEEAVNRDIAAWSKGPPAGWLDQMQAYMQQKAAYDQAMADAVQAEQLVGVADPAQAQQAAAQQLETSGMAVPQAPAVPFEDRPCHQEQLIAIYRHRAFSRMQDTVEYTKQPLLWRIPFNERYEQSRVAAGVATVAEQQQAAQAQAQAQTQGARSDGDQKAAAQDKELHFKSQEAEKDRTASAEENARTLMSKEALSAQKTTGAAGQAKAGGSVKLPLRRRTPA